MRLHPNARSAARGGGGFPCDAIDVYRERAALRASFVVRARGSGSGMSRQSETTSALRAPEAEGEIPTERKSSVAAA